MKKVTDPASKRRIWYLAAIILALELPLMALLPKATSQSVQAGGSAYTVSVAGGTGPLDSPILTDSSGMTLYFNAIDADTVNLVGEAARSRCYNLCRDAWPPLGPTMELGPGTSVNNGGYLVETPTLDPKAQGSLAVSKRLDGIYQITYNGRPLYRYSGDLKPGDRKGINVDGIWFAAYPGLEPPQPASTLPPVGQPVPALPVPSDQP